MPTDVTGTASEARIRILMVEDDPVDVELVSDQLRDQGLDCQIHHVDTKQAYVQALESFDADIVLSDLGMPDFDGHLALRLLRKRDATLPFIFVSGTMGEEAAVEALRDGANDYILKSNPIRLLTAVRRALREAQEQRDLRRAEAELIRTQRFESLAMLAGGLSHDLRNLLQPLLLAADTLEEYADDARLLRLGALVRGCGRHGLEMVASMLSFARGARRIEMIRIGALFNALGLLLQGSVPRTVSLVIAPDDAELEFEGNLTELQQCLLNLCLNAVQAMPDGGQLKVTARELTLDTDFFTTNETSSAGVYLEMAVSDTGIGMPEPVLAQLYQPFFTTRRDGSGLGLVSCKRIIASCGGVMRVDSTPAVGTCFRLYLPLHADAATASISELPLGRGERVLVVVEDALRLSLLAHTLEACGYEVCAQQSGTAALQSLDDDGLPQLVLMDADMNLLTGVRTLAALLDRDYHGAVLLLAQPDKRPDLDGLPPLPHLRVLDKPIPMDELMHAVRAALDACEGGTSPRI